MESSEQGREVFLLDRNGITTKPSPGWWRFEGVIIDHPIKNKLDIMVKVNKDGRVLIPGYAERPDVGQCNGIFIGPIDIKNIVPF